MVQPPDDRLVTEARLPALLPEIQAVETLDVRYGGVRVTYQGDVGAPRPDAPIVTWVDFPEPPLFRQVGDVLQRPAPTFDRLPTVSDAGTALPLPGLVGALTATSGEDAQTLVTWAAPAVGQPILEYRLRYSPGGSTTFIVVPGSQTSYRLTGLTNGTAHTVSVVARNATGSGAAATSAAFTPAGSTVAPSRAYQGASTNNRVNNSRVDSFADLEQRMRAAGGYTDQVMTIRHTFNSSAIPVSWAGSLPAADPGLGVKASLLNTGRDTQTFLQIADEYDAWRTAGRPNRPGVAGSAQTSWDTAYPWQFKKRRWIVSARDTMPAGHFLYDGGHHEPGFIGQDGNQPDDTGVPGMQTWQVPDLWAKMQAYHHEIILRDGGGRVRPVTILQGADFRNYKFPDGTTRTVDHWNFWKYLNTAQLAASNLAVDIYDFHPTVGITTLMQQWDTIRRDRGFGYCGLAEFAINVGSLNADGSWAYKAGEPTEGARFYGDPTYTKGLRYMLSQVPSCEFACTFDSNVTTGTATSAEHTFIFPHNWLLRAFAQSIKGDPYNVPATLTKYTA